MPRAVVPDGSALSQGVHSSDLTARASAIFAEAVALHRALGDAAGVAMSLINQGNVLVRIGAYESATQAYHECLELRHPLGDVVHIALTLGNLGFAEREQAHITRAAALQPVMNRGVVDGYGCDDFDGRRSDICDDIKGMTPGEADRRQAIR